MVEPYLSEQWFVKMKPLAQDVLDDPTIRNDIAFVYFNVENLRSYNEKYGLLGSNKSTEEKLTEGVRIIEIEIKSEEDIDDICCTADICGCSCADSGGGTGRQVW